MNDSIYRPPYRRPSPARRSLPAIPSGPVLLEDDFDDNVRDTAKWTLGSVAFENTGVGVDEANQQLEISPLANELNPAIYGYKSVGGYNFTAREARVRIAADIGTGTEAWLVVAVDNDNYFRTWVAGGTLQTRSRVNLTNSNQSHGAFDFATHTYWRIRHDNDTDEIVWEYSSSGSSWNELRRLARPFSITFMRVYLSGGTGSSIASPALVKFDDFALKTPDAFATIERSAAIDTTGTISSTGEFFSIFTASVAISASAAVESAGTAFTVFERSTAIDAGAGIATSGQRDLLRSASASATATVEVSGARVVERSVAVSATGTVESSGIAFSVFEATVSIDASASIESSGVGFSIVEAAAGFSVTGAVTIAGVREVERSASYAATAAIESSGESFTLFEAAVAISTTASIESAGTSFSVFGRQSSLDCTATITAAGQSELLRQAALSATGTITVAGQVGDEPVVHERSAAFGASGEVTSAGEFFSVITASVALSSTASVTVGYQRELQRLVAVGVTGTITSSGTVVGAVVQRSVSLTATATITTSAAVHHPAPPKRTFMVGLSQRTTVVPPEVRVFKPGSNNRSYSA